MRYADIIPESLVDGTGIRVVAFFQGCPRVCEGCHNPALQPVDGGREVSEEVFANMILNKITPLHTGVTFSGGDPLLQAESLQRVISLIKEKKPALNFWCYTGYTFEQVKDWPVLKMIDVLVDGPFILKQRDLTLPFRGSANQRVIDVPASLSQGEAVIRKL